MNSFRAIQQRAEKRKGGKDALLSLLPSSVSEDAITAQSDAYFLAEMTRSIFQCGFVWRFINNKWPGFCEAFFDFDQSRLMRLSEDDWGNFLKDTRIVRHRQKIQSVRHNLWFVHEISVQENGFG